MGEFVRALEQKRVHEVFGCGTAVVVSPVNGVHYKGKDYDVPIDESVGAGKLTKRMWKAITDIQYGRTPHEWSVVVE
eukprot:CAMPEP_0116857226 /NCGR_PEP_ID=MMETSP0418-20121206/20416_1 /TAXON_ID=1158023 /ORGANISM="Astrosyne radiata, Strain 13vi08-1A" /LENGTH=76 /DNA_ID=CAMNT_0004490847 /DNA_START=8 /DNA_END=238 /DNA_ORIENTATION=-